MSKSLSSSSISKKNKVSTLSNSDRWVIRCAHCKEILTNNDALTVRPKCLIKNSNFKKLFYRKMLSIA